MLSVASLLLWPRLCDKQLDAASHFMLRLLCCRDGYAAQWLLDAEEALLRQRWQQASRHQQQEALESCGAGRWMVSGQQLVEISMPFQELPTDMLAKRRARLRRGIATVAQEDGGSAEAT